MTEGDLTARLDRMEAQLRLLSAAVGIPFADHVPTDVVALARSDERIKAAIRLTEMTGMDLDDARRVVNRL
jgi:hypothetical protein